MAKYTIAQREKFPDFRVIGRGFINNSNEDPEIFNTISKGNVNKINTEIKVYFMIEAFPFFL